MWQGIFPAVTTKFTAGDTLDIAEMEQKRYAGIARKGGLTG